MTRRGLGLLPPLLAGVAGAVALETSAGLLLYADDGLLPALTLILTVEMGALGLGLWSAPLPVGGGAVEQIRRRWIFCLVTFALASALGAGLNLISDLPGTGISQGVGLGFLGALPLFSLGTLLGAMGRPDNLGPGAIPAVGPPAVVGAGIGFLLSGAVLLPNTAPHTLYLFCLVILSGGALLQGWVLDARIVVEVLETVSVPRGDLRAERRFVGSPRTELRLLLEGGVIRGVEGAEGEPGLAWESAVLEGLTAERIQPESVLYLGGGSGTLIRHLSQRFPHARMRVVERHQELVGLAKSHFAPWDGWGEVEVIVGDPLAREPERGSLFSVTVLDCAALPILGGVPWMREADWRFLAGSHEPGGVLVLGGLRSTDGDLGGNSTRVLGEVAGEAAGWFESVSLYRKAPTRDGGRLLPEWAGSTEFFLLLSTRGRTPWPAFLAGFGLHSENGD